MDKDLLEILEDKKLHVHSAIEDFPLPGIPIATQMISTHYLMHGPNIVYCGNTQGLKQFAINFKYF